jgi:hypothetical protein
MPRKAQLGQSLGPTPMGAAPDAPQGVKNKDGIVAAAYAAHHEYPLVLRNGDCAFSAWQRGGGWPTTRLAAREDRA